MLLIISFPKTSEASGTPTKSTKPLLHLSIFLPIQPSHHPSRGQTRSVCLCGTYHGRCWGMWGELSCSLPVCPLWCPQGRPSAVSRPPLPLSWGSHSYCRGTETLHIYIHTVGKQSWHLRKWVCWSICKDSQQSSWADLTWRKRRLARRSLPPCSLQVNRNKQRQCEQTNSMRQSVCLKQVNNNHVKSKRY